MILFNVIGTYQIEIDGIAVEPISNLFPHSFEYKIGENGDWISAPEGAPFSNPSPVASTAQFNIFGNTDDVNEGEFIYRWIDFCNSLCKLYLSRTWCSVSNTFTKRCS